MATLARYKRFNGTTWVDYEFYTSIAAVSGLQAALNSKLSVETDPTVPAHVKAITTANINAWNNKSNFSGSYNDLTNKPTIPAAQVNSNWNATSGVAQILNKPVLATVATSGSYNDLSNKPTIPPAYNLPTATATVLGGVKAKAKTTESVEVAIDSSTAKLYVPTYPSKYTLPKASYNVLGGVMPVIKTETMTQEVGVDVNGQLYTKPGSGGGGSEWTLIGDWNNVTYISLDTTCSRHMFQVYTSLAGAGAARQRNGAGSTIVDTSIFTSSVHSLTKAIRRNGVTIPFALNTTESSNDTIYFIKFLPELDSDNTWGGSLLSMSIVDINGATVPSISNLRVKLYGGN